MLTPLRRLGGLCLLLALAGCPTPVKTPSADVGSPTVTANTGAVVQLDGTRSNDPQSRPLSYEWSFVLLPQGSHATLNDAHSATPSFVADAPGIYRVQLVVANAFLASAPATQTIQVGACGSQSPVTGTLALAPASPGVGTVVTLSAPASKTPDNDPACAAGETLSYAWRLVAQPAGSTASLNNASAQQPSFTADFPGTYTARLVITASNGKRSDPADVNVAVVPCGNAVPSINAIGVSTEIPRIGQTVQLNPDVSTSDNAATGCNLGETFTYAWSTVQLPQGSHATLNATATRNPSFTPDVKGTYTFSLVATASNGRSSLPFTRDLAVSDLCGANVPAISFPALAGIAPIIGVGQLLQAQVDDADTLCTPPIRPTFSYAWSLVQLPVGGAAQLTNPTSSTPTFLAQAGGTYTVQLTVLASTGVSGTKTVDIAVKPCGNAAPTIGGLAQTTPATSTGTARTPNPGDSVTISALNVLDPDNLPSCGAQQKLSYAWTLTNRPLKSNAFIADPTALAATFTTDQAGTYQASLVVTDSTGLPSAPAFLSITTTNCGLATPAIAITSPAGGAAFKPNPGQAVALTAATSDTDIAVCGINTTVGVLWQVVSHPANSGAALLAPNQASTTFTPDVPGTYQFSAVATAANNGFSSPPAFVSFTTSTCGSNAPTVSVTQATFQNATPRQPISLTALPGSIDNTNPTCNAGKTFSYLWRVASRPQTSTAVFSDPTVNNPTFTPDAPGNYQLSVVVTDSTHLASDPAYVDVTVSSCGVVGPSVAGINVLSPGLASVRVGAPVQVGAGYVTANNCLIPTAIKSVPANAAGTFAVNANDQLALLLNGALRVHTFQASDFAVAGSATAAEIAKSLTADTALGVTATATDAGKTVSLVDASGLGAELQATTPPCPVALVGGSCPVPAVNANAALGLPTGRSLSLLYSWSIVGRPFGSQALLDNPALATPSFTPDRPGAYQLKLVATNGLQYSSDPVFLTVNAADCSGSQLVWDATAPITKSFLDPEGSFPSISTGAHVTLTPHFTDPNFAACGSVVQVAPYTYRWAIVSTPPGSRAALSAAGDPTPTFVPDVVGSYQVSASVSDALGNVAPTIFYTVKTSSCGANQPTLSIDPVPAAAPWLANTVNSFTAVPLNVTNATASDGDLNGAVCPTRFQTNFSFSYLWSIAQQPTSGRATLSSTGGTAVSFAAYSSGTYTVQVTATASNGLTSAPAQVTLQVQDCGSHPPSILSVQTTTLVGGVATPVSRPAVGSTVTATLLGTDADETCGPAPRDDIARFTWSIVSLPSGSALTVPAPGSAQTVPVPGSNKLSTDFKLDVAGTYVLSAFATDTHGLNSTPVTVTLTTATCGPVFSGIASTVPAPYIGQAVTLRIDPAGAQQLADNCVVNPTYTYAWTLLSRPPGSQAALATPAAATTGFTPDAVGTYQFQLVVTDNAGNPSVPATVAFNASSCGTVAPTLLGASGTATPAIGFPAKVYVGDVTALTLPNLYDANADAAAATPGKCSAAQVTPYRYSWRLLATPQGSRATLTSTADASPSFVPDVPGNYQISAQVTDALGNVSATQVAAIAVSNCGFNAPVPAISSGLATVNANAQLTLTASSTDADDTSCPARFANPANSMRYSWSIVGTPAGGRATLSPTVGTPTSNTTSFSSAVPGQYTVQLIATDSTSLSGATTQTITVNQCGASTPVITSLTAPVSRPPVSSTVTLTASAFDADTVPAAQGGVCGATGLPPDTSFTWTLVSAPAGSSYSVPASANGLGKSSLVVNVDRAGTYVVSVVASDSTGLSSAPATISVPTGTCGPDLGTGITVSSSPAATPTAGSLLAFQQNGTITDLCIAQSPPAVTLTWSLLSKPATSSATVDPASGKLTPDVPGTYQVQLLGTDSGGFSSTQTLSVNVGGCTSAPSIAAATPIALTANEPNAGGVAGSATLPLGPGQDAFAGDRVDLQPAAITAGSCNAASSTTYTYAWSLVSKPQGSNAQLTSSTVARPSLTVDQPNATWQVALTVTDSNGNASPPYFRTITTAPCGGQLPPFTVTAAVAGNPSVTTPAAAPLAVTVNTYASLGLSASVAANAGDNQNDPTKASFCPARFAMTVSYSWALVSTPAGGKSALSGASGSSVAFQPLSPSLAGGPYVVQAIASGTNGVPSQPLQVAVTAAQCGAYAPRALDVGTTKAFVASQSGTTPLSRVDGDLTALDSNVPVQIVANVVDLDTLASTATAVDPATGVGTAGCGIAGVQGLTVQWSISQLPAGSRAVLSGANTVTPSFTPDVPGRYTLQLTATDSTNATSTQQFGVVSNGCGTSAFTVGAPAASQTAGSATLTLASTPGMDLAFPITVSQPVGDTNTCATLTEAVKSSWAFTSVPPGSRAQLSSAQSGAPSFLPDVLGAYTLVQTASNTTGQVQQLAPVSIKVTCGGAAPVVSKLAVKQALPNTSTPDGSATNPFSAGYPVQLDPTAGTTDADTAGPFPSATCAAAYPDSVTYAWSFDSLPTGSTAHFNDATASKPSFTPDVANATYVVRVTATDAWAHSSVQRFTYQTGACGTQSPAPVIRVLAPIATGASPVANQVSTGLVVQVDASSTTSPDALPACNLPRTFTYQWSMASAPSGSGTLVAGSPSAFSNATLTNPTFVADLQGAYSVQLVATDNNGRSAATRLTINAVGASGNVDSASNVSSTWFASAIDPLSGNPVVAVWDPNGTSAKPNSGAIKVYRCTSNCTGSSNLAPVFTAPSNPPVVVDEGLGTLTATPKEDPVPVAVTVTSAGEVLIAYFSLNGTPNNGNRPCSITLYSNNGGATSYRTSIGAGQSGCSAGGTTGGENGRWLSLSLDSTGAWALAYTNRNLAASTGSVDWAYCTTGCGPSVAAGATTSTATAGTLVAGDQNIGKFVSLSATPTGTLPNAQFVYDVQTPNRALTFNSVGAAPPGSPTPFAVGTTPVTFTGVGTDAGRYASLVNDGTTNHVVFYDASKGELVYERCTGVSSTACTSLAAFTPLFVDGPDAAPGNPVFSIDAGQNASLAVDASFVSVTYLDQTNGLLKLARAPLTAGVAGAFTQTSIAAGALSSSLTTQAGKPRIFYAQPGKTPQPNIVFFAQP